MHYSIDIMFGDTVSILKNTLIVYMQMFVPASCKCFYLIGLTKKSCNHLLLVLIKAVVNSFAQIDQKVTFDVTDCDK